MDATVLRLPIHDSDLTKALDATEDYYRTYVRFPDDHCYTVVALWIAHTWTSDSFYSTPRLILDSAEPGSGKTRVLELMNYLAYSTVFTNNSTAAYLLSKVNEGGTPPTLLVDETDLLFAKGTGENAGIISMLNSGYKKGATTGRASMGKSEDGANTVEYRSFAPVALAGIAGKMPDPLVTRGITIHMRKRRSSEHVEPWRERFAEDQTRDIKQVYANWAEENAAAITVHTPEPVDGVRDRSEEIWEPLLAVAEFAGEEWTQRARAACRWFVVERKSNAAMTPGVQLLRDIRIVFESKRRVRMPTADLIHELCEVEDSIWADYNRGGRISPKQLAQMLSRYEIKAKSIRQGKGVARGYEAGGVDGLADAWDRYL